MPEPDAHKPTGLGDLFDNLPDATSPLPDRAAPEEPAPGSRRARRAAAQRESGDARGAEGASIPGPSPAGAAPHSDFASVSDSASADRDVTAAASTTAAAEPAPAPLDDLFAPEQHREVPKKRRGRGCLIGLIIVVIILGGIAAGGIWAMNTYGDKINELMGWGEPKDYEAGMATGEAYVTIKSGDTGSPVSTALYSAGVTKTDRVFYEWLLKENPSAQFYPGVYKLQKKMTAEAALAAIEDPANRMENTVRIGEGSTIESSLPRIVDGVGIPLEELEAAVKDPSVYGVNAESLEGWLFPAIYTFDPGATAEDVIARMVERTRASLESAGVPDADAERILVIASIIEREGRTPDFPKVSRVIQNRLDKGMKLQMDSTSQYGYGELHAGRASTSKEAQHDQNAWNTYEISGLPKSPIANPGDDAIEAAMHPADGPWLYFVTINLDTGETQFSETYAEHERGIEKWDAWCKANPDSGC
ncbi:protein YceG like [Microbacterium esteraromaticum]|uniref:Endolytic murein transglycosylase n=1 Tax=Microbacterium esteraromaticum TaxID=57043 RepID=A0A1R4IT71_9MICO|nr:endolytic transglycosylase MltG [Microbacterium esteraromaticum]SJN22755.1 protein YceG like [Microbacterium esteraromaticum]